MTSNRVIPAAIDAKVVAVVQAHLLAGPRTGQCLCGHIGELGTTHSVHLAAELRAAGLLVDR